VAPGGGPRELRPDDPEAEPASLGLDRDRVEFVIATERKTITRD